MISQDMADKALTEELRVRARIERERRETIERCALAAERVLAGRDGNGGDRKRAMRVANAIRAVKNDVPRSTPLHGQDPEKGK